MSWWYPLFTRTTPFPGNFPSWLPREQVTSHFWFFVKRQKVKHTTRPKSNSIKLVYFWRQVENRHPFPSPPAQLLIAKLYLHLYFKNTDIRHFLTCWISKSIHLHLCTTPSVLHITAGHPPMAARVWGSSPAVLEFGSLARSGVAASCLCVCVTAGCHGKMGLDFQWPRHLWMQVCMPKSNSFPLEPCDE